MTKAARRKVPSRVKYEQTHPTVSCRLPREIYDRLVMIRKTRGKSFADVLKIGLGVLEVKAGKEEDVRKEGYQEAHRKGYSEAEGLYKVAFLAPYVERPFRLPAERPRKPLKNT